MKTINLSQWISQTIQAVKEKTEFPQIEIHAIASHILGNTREWIMAHPDTEIDESKLSELNSAVDRLITGEPLAYITGKRSFFGLEFQITPDVLIPRPETEILVEEVISWLELHTKRRSMADIGTGSGAIAVACADRFPDLQITAIDISANALKIASQNAMHNHVADQIDFVQGDLLDHCDLKFDVIAANLPYIPTNELASLDVIKFEPRLALDGGPDGLTYIKKLLEQAQKNLLPGGCLFLEIEYNQLNVMTIAKEKFPLAAISLVYDLVKLPRLIKIQFHPAG